MNNEMNMKLPTNCTMMTEDEMMNVNGGFEFDTHRLHQQKQPRFVEI